MESTNRPQQSVEAYEAAMDQAGGRQSLVERFGEVVVKLSQPLETGSRALTELRLDFLGLTGLDMEIIDDQIGAMGLRGMLPAYSRKYQRMLAARAAGVEESLLLKLPLADYNAVTGAAQNFLLVSG